MSERSENFDVLCVGHASYDLIFSVPHQPAEDEKMLASGLLGCGGGPAANAAVTVARLGFSAAFAGYLGQDLYGESHVSELQNNGVDTSLILRGALPTPLSAILVKPNGSRALINFKGNTQALTKDRIDFSRIVPKSILFDGHEPHISLSCLQRFKAETIPSILDAGSLHDGTLALLAQVDYLVCSEKFARQYAVDPLTALPRLAALSPTVVITLGEQGLLWQRGQEHGCLPAPPIKAIDTTGAGDAFHGAFAAAVASNMAWPDVLRYASVAGAYCCTQLGARPGLPNRLQHAELLAAWQTKF